MAVVARDVRQPPKGEDWRKDWKAYGVLASSAAQRRAIQARGDDGLCAGCGQRVACWNADHVQPLHNITPSQLADYPAVLRFWAVGNLQCLGVSCGCHSRKTNLERTRNAKVLRIIKKAAPKQHDPAKSKTWGKLWPKPKIPAGTRRKRLAYAARQRERAREWRRAEYQRRKALMRPKSP